MGSSFSKTNEQLDLTARSFQDFDGIGFKRPSSLPQPTEKSLIKLRQLILSNNNTFNVFYPKSRNRPYHNHTAHALSSAYFLGASPQELYRIYEHETEPLDQWETSDALEQEEVTIEDWTTFIGNRKRIEELFNFFKDEILEKSSSFQWRQITKKFLIQGTGEKDIEGEYEDVDEDDTPSGTNDNKSSDTDSIKLATGLLGGLTHPLIHLGYAVELNSWVLAGEALTIAAVDYGTYYRENVYKHIKEMAPLPAEATITSKTKEDLSKKLLYFLNNTRHDDRLNGKNSNHPGFITGFIRDNSSIIAEHTAPIIDFIDRECYNKDNSVNANKVDMVLQSFLQASIWCFADSYKEIETPLFDFFLLHLVTSVQELIEVISLSTDLHNSTNLDTSEANLPIDRCYYNHVKDEDVIITKDYIPELLKGYWVLFMGIYMYQGRSLIDISRTSKTFDTYEESGSITSENIWAKIYSLLFDPEDPSKSMPTFHYDSHSYKVIRSLLCATRFLATPGDQKQNEEVFMECSKAAYIVAKTMRNEKFIGFNYSTEHLDII